MKYTKRFSHDNIKFYSKSRFELVPASWLPVFNKRSSVNDENCTYELCYANAFSYGVSSWFFLYSGYNHAWGSHDYLNCFTIVTMNTNQNNANISTRHPQTIQIYLSFEVWDKMFLNGPFDALITQHFLDRCRYAIQFDWLIKLNI